VNDFADTDVARDAIAAARARFPVLEHVAYLNAGSFGPLARSTLDVMREEQDRDLVEGRSGLPYFSGALDLRAEVRARLAALVRVDPANVALTTSTTEACSIVVSGLDLGAGDEVVTTTDEHFGLLGSLGASGARVVVVPPDPDRILAAVSDRTRLIAVSHVLWTTGAVLPVRELRTASGVPVLVDGAQSVGAVDVDATGIDFTTISGQKWLCGPDATGALVVAEPERLRVASPSYFSQVSFEADGVFVPRDGAPRFERSWWSRASLRGFMAALTERPDWGFERALAMTRRCRDLLDGHVEIVDGGPSTLVAFRLPHGDPAALVERLHDVGVRVRELPGRGLVRASVGWWTSDDDLDRLVAGIVAA
jgi:L-cysteine/cystine lyase